MGYIRQFIKWAGTDNMNYFMFGSWTTSIFGHFGFWAGVTGFIYTLCALFIDFELDQRRDKLKQFIFAIAGGVFSLLIWLWGDHVVSRIEMKYLVSMLN